LIACVFALNTNELTIRITPWQELNDNFNWVLQEA
jgi:hypothetical protein